MMMHDRNRMVRAGMSPYRLKFILKGINCYTVYTEQETFLLVYFGPIGKLIQYMIHTGI